jgi:hypothetical protein
MIGTGLNIVRYLGDTPSVAECRNCHVNFFTPLELIGKVLAAERHLSYRFILHSCRSGRKNNLATKHRTECAYADWSERSAAMPVIIPYF